jgi:hypothetical protein
MGLWPSECPVDEALLVWTAAIDSGFAQPSEWVAWADERILRLEEPPLWLLNLSLASSARDALGVVWPACRFVAPEAWTPLDWNGLFLGFLYLRFERGDFNMLELLLQGGRKTELANYRVGCEAFFELANELDVRGPTRPSNRSLPDRVADLFGPLAGIARHYWSRLRDEPA